jgi:RNA polymerase sigma-B factor
MTLAESVTGAVADTTTPELLDKFQQFHTSRDRELRNELVMHHQWIAVHCARKFADRGEPMADLVQVAQLGVLKSVERFDPARGVQFTSYALPTVLGELRRHFRDAAWMLRVPRRPKDRYLEVNRTAEKLAQKLNRTPTVEDIAQDLSIGHEEVLEALEAGQAYRARSIDQHPASDSGRSLGETLRSRVPEPDLVDSVLTRESINLLSPRKRSIVYMCFYEGRTQQEIGEELGVSQVQVSRLLRSALDELRKRIAIEVDDPRSARIGVEKS